MHPVPSSPKTTQDWHLQGCSHNLRGRPSGIRRGQQQHLHLGESIENGKNPLMRWLAAKKEVLFVESVFIIYTDIWYIVWKQSFRSRDMLRLFFQVWSRRASCFTNDTKCTWVSNVWLYMLSTQLQFVLTKGKELAAFSFVFNDLHFSLPCTGENMWPPNFKKGCHYHWKTTHLRTVTSFVRFSNNMVIETLIRGFRALNKNERPKWWASQDSPAIRT